MQRLRHLSAHIANPAAAADGSILAVEMFQAGDDAGAFQAEVEGSRARMERAGASIVYDSTAFMDPVAMAGGGIAWDRFRVSLWPTRAAFLGAAEHVPAERPGCAQHMLHGFATARNDLKLDESNPDEIFVLNLLRFKGIEGRMSYSQYGKVTQSLMKRDDVAAKGPVLMGHAWLGGGPGAPDPELAIHSEQLWEDMYLVQYPTLGALFEMNSKPEWTEADKKYRSGDRKLGEEGGEANAEGGGGGGVELTWAFPSSAVDTDASKLMAAAAAFRQAKASS